jgi:hypothetical protein
VRWCTCWHWRRILRQACASAIKQTTCTLWNHRPDWLLIQIMTLILNGHAKRSLMTQHAGCEPTMSLMISVTCLSVIYAQESVIDHQDAVIFKAWPGRTLKYSGCDDRSMWRYYTGRQTGRSQFLEAFSRSRLLPGQRPDAKQPFRLEPS